MKIQEVVDLDGRPFHVAAKSVSLCRRLAFTLHDEAERLGCNMRNIPRLGSPAGGDWHPAFKVTERDGTVVGIRRLRHIARPRDPT